MTNERTRSSVPETLVRPSAIFMPIRPIFHLLSRREMIYCTTRDIEREGNVDEWHARS